MKARAFKHSFFQNLDPSDEAAGIDESDKPLSILVVGVVGVLVSRELEILSRLMDTCGTRDVGRNQ